MKRERSARADSAASWEHLTINSVSLSFCRPAARTSEALTSAPTRRLIRVDFCRNRLANGFAIFVLTLYLQYYLRSLESRQGASSPVLRWKYLALEIWLAFDLRI